jgi:hypothetical protein
MKMGDRAENVKRAFSGAIWEPSAGYCRAVRSGNIIAGKQRSSHESTPIVHVLSTVFSLPHVHDLYLRCLASSMLIPQRNLAASYSQPSQFIQSLCCSLHNAMLGMQQSLLTTDSSEVV